MEIMDMYRHDLTNVVRDFINQYPGSSLESEKFLNFLTVLWNQGDHKRLYSFLGENDIFVGDLLQRFNDNKYEVLYSMLLLIKETRAQYRNNLFIPDWDKLFHFVYGDVDYKDINATIGSSVAGKLKYLLWFFYLNKKGERLLAWELFDTKIYPMFKTSNTERSLRDATATKRYLDELLSLIYVINGDPAYYEQIKGEAVRNINNFFRIAIYPSRFIDEDYKFTLCRYLFILMNKKEMYNEAFELYRDYKQEFNVLKDSQLLKELLNLVYKKKDYHTTNMVFGDIISAKSKIENYLNSIDNDIKRIQTFLISAKEFIENDKIGLQAFKKDYMSFFFDCKVYDLSQKHVDRGKHELLENLLKALRCFYSKEVLKQKNGPPVEFQLSHLIKNDAVIDAKTIHDDIRSKIPCGSPDYTLFLLSEEIPKLQKLIIQHYLDHLMDTVNAILQERGSFIGENWDEDAAERSFINSYNSISLQPNSGERLNESDKRRFELAANQVNSILKYDEVAKLLKTAEWLWNNNIHLLKSLNADVNGQELTYIVANYLKSVEVFLKHKFEDIIMQNPKVNFKGIGRYNISIGSRNWANNITMGGFYKYIEEKLDDNLEKYFMKTNVKRSQVKKYIKHWTDYIRNAHFHKDCILSISKAEEIRYNTILLLRRLVADMVCFNIECCKKL